MANNYSNKELKPLTIDAEDGLRVYKGFKLNSYQVMTEGFKMLRVLMPSFGTGIDQMTNDNGLEIPNTFGAMMQLLNENLSEEQFTTLADKLLGSLVFNGDVVEDWVDHFDQYPQDLIEVLGWSGKENFYNFFYGKHYSQIEDQDVNGNGESESDRRNKELADRQRNRHKRKQLKLFSEVSEFPSIDFWFSEIANSEFNTVRENVLMYEWCFEEFLLHSNKIRMFHDQVKLEEDAKKEEEALNNPLTNQNRW